MAAYTHNLSSYATCDTGISRRPRDLQQEYSSGGAHYSRRDLLIDSSVREVFQQLVIDAGALEPDIKRCLAELHDGEIVHLQREQIGLNLARANDPRHGVGVVNAIPDILWCAIPGGDLRRRDWLPCSIVTFQMAAYPVTNTQYEAFLTADDGHDRDKWWDGLCKPEPADRNDVRRQGNLPVTNVCWDEANAFCRWLSEKLSLEIRLPNEWEWQWAAQSGPHGFDYAWGAEWLDDLANTSETGIGRTTAVGLNPGGQSRQGVFDLSGNTWEWCQNPFNEEGDHHPQSERSRSVRGGSCLDPSRFARPAHRDGAPHSLRAEDLGFRVVYTCAK